MRRMTGVLVAGLLAACAQKAAQNAGDDQAAPPAADLAPAMQETAIPGSREKHVLLEEPRGAMDPKSAEAAGQIVQHYGALVEQGRWHRAEALWGDAASAAAFSTALRTYASAHLEIGKLGRIEGAAGSSYVEIPISFYGRYERGGSYRRPASVTLRRVNDVPGSTEAQRRWHIERIEWTP
jgi:hypothetical protein